MNEIALRLAARLFDQPVIQNQYRSAFVEAMIEPYLARSGWRYVGDNWAGWDFEHEFGTRLELKQSAAWQTWDPVKQATLKSPEKAGLGVFDIALRTGWFDSAGVAWTKETRRPAHVYVFAWNGRFGSAALGAERGRVTTLGPPPRPGRGSESDDQHRSRANPLAATAMCR